MFMADLRMEAIERLTRVVARGITGVERRFGFEHKNDWVVRKSSWPMLDCFGYNEEFTLTECDRTVPEVDGNFA